MSNNKKKNPISLVYFKEMKSIFRDKRMMISLLSPILLMPVIFGVMGVAIFIFANQDSVIGTNNINHPIIQELATEQAGHFTFIESENPGTEMLEGKIIAAITFPEDFDENLENNQKTTIEFLSEPSNQAATSITATLDQMVKEKNTALLDNILLTNGIDTDAGELIQIKSSSISSTGEIAESTGVDQLKSVFSSVIPMIIIIASASGVFSIATELGAGEKEKNSFEVLLSTQASRESIIGGKLLATVSFGLISFIAFISSFLLIGLGAILFFPDILGYIQEFINPLGLFLTIIILVLTTTFISCLALTISMMANTYKESQAYLSYMSLVFILPTYFTMFNDIRNIPPVQLHIPLLNHINILTQISNGIIDWGNILIVIGWSIAYIFITIFIIKHFLKKESFLFN